MRFILVVSKEQEAFHTIHACFRQGHRVDEAPNKDVALEMLRKERYDFVFIFYSVLQARL